MYIYRYILVYLHEGKDLINERTARKREGLKGIINI